MKLRTAATISAIFVLPAIGIVAMTPDKSPATPVAWEHGWKTDRVIATRYNNPVMGYNIRFDLPKNCYDADSVSMYDWLQERGVNIYQGGGAPCAANYALVKGVTDRQSADEFLVKFLPEFDSWVRTNLR